MLYGTEQILDISHSGVLPFRNLSRTLISTSPIRFSPQSWRFSSASGISYPTLQMRPSVEAWHPVSPDPFVKSPPSSTSTYFHELQIPGTEQQIHHGRTVFAFTIFVNIPLFYNSIFVCSVQYQRSKSFLLHKVQTHVNPKPSSQNPSSPFPASYVQQESSHAS